MDGEIEGQMNGLMKGGVGGWMSMDCCCVDGLLLCWWIVVVLMDCCCVDGLLLC
jgi:hypothetical protein